MFVKLINFVKQKKEYFIPLLLLTLFLTIGFAIMGYYPLGKNSLAHYDTYHQIVPKLSLIFDFFEGRIVNFYSFSVSGGANILGYVLYFIFSPFYLLVLPFGRENLFYSINVILIAYLFAILLIAIFFIKKFGKGKVSSANTILLSLLYTLSVYFLISYTWITWLNFLILMPLLILAFKNVIKNGKIFWFSFLLTCVIYTCFALGVFALILLFLFFTLYILMVESKEKQKPLFTKTILSFVVAVLFALPLLLPSLDLFLVSSRNIDGVSNLFKARLFYHTIDRIFLIIAETVLLFFTIVFLIKCNKKDKFNKFLFVVLGFLLALTLIEPVFLALNFGSYLGYPNRLGFLITLFMFICSIKLLEQPSITDEHLNNAPTKSALEFKQDFFFYGGAGFTIIIFAFILSYISGSTAFYNAQVNIYSFFLYLIVAGGLLIALFYLSKKLALKQLTKKVFLTFFIIITFLQVSFNFTLFIISTPQNISQFQNASAITENIDSVDRVKFITEEVDGILPVALCKNTFSGFSSLIDSLVIESAEQLGYHPQLNYISSSGGTLLSDALVGYKYYVSDKLLDLPNLTLLAEENELFLYENTLSLSNAYLLPNINLHLSSAKTEFEKQNIIFNTLGGHGDLFENFDIFSENVTLVNLTVNKRENSLQIKKIDNSKPAYISVDYTASKDVIIYANIKSYSSEMISFDITVNDDINYNNLRRSKLQTVTSIKKGESVTFTLTPEFDTVVEALSFGVMDYTKLETVINEIQYQSRNVLASFTSNEFNVFIAEESEYKHLVLPYINLRGFSATLNGKETNINSNFLNFLSIELNNGQSTATFVYQYKNFNLLMIISLISIILGVLILLANKYSSKILHKFDKTFYYSGLGVASIIVLVMFVLPTLVYVYRVLTFISNLVFQYK